MGLSKYFTVKVKPTITASLQTGVFTAGDVVWDWTSFEVPKGTNRIIGATLMVRGTNGTGAATNGNTNPYIYLAFAESPLVNSGGVPTNAR